MSTLLLNNFNGTDGATTFTDEVPGVTWTRGGNADAELDTAQPKFGTASLRLPAAGFGTFESWVQATGFSSPHAGDWCAEVFGRASAGGGATGELRLLLLDGSGNELAALLFQEGTDSWSCVVLNSAFSVIVNQSGGTPFAESVFYHFAIQRDASAGTWAGYFNGVRLFNVSAADSGSFTRLRLYHDDSTDSHFDSVRLTNELLYSGATYSVPSTQFSLGLTVNIEAFSFEADREHASSSGTLNLGTQSSEVDYEASEVSVRLTQSDPQSQYDYEAGSPALAHTHVVSVDSLEAGWEISLQQSVATGAMEFDWEAPDVGIPIDVFLGTTDSPFERHWEADSPRLYSKNFLRSVTPTRRRIIAGRRSAARTLTPLLIVEVTASRRTEVVRV